MRRKAMSSRSSKKMFNKGRKSNKKNVSLPPLRGGFRL